jgi:chlorophyll synthase
MGVRSLPVQLGVENAAKCACIVMALPQVIVISLLISWDHPHAAAIVGVMLLTQLFCMRRWLKQPKELAPWYNGTGVTLYVLGMLVSASALSGVNTSVGG